MDDWVAQIFDMFELGDLNEILIFQCWCETYNSQHFFPVHLDEPNDQQQL